MGRWWRNDVPRGPAPSYRIGPGTVAAVAVSALGPPPDLRPADELDAADPLAGFRDEFVHAEDEPGFVYLDGNSLGRLPLRAVALASEVVERQWGHRLIRSWNEGWFDLPIRLGDRLAGLVGAGPGEVVLADNTSVCLYKAAVAALGVRPDRTRILTDDLNFPSDVQVLRAAARAAGPEHEVVVVGSDGVHGPLDGLRAALDDRTALVSLSHVAYRSGWSWDLGDVTGMAHDAGALVLWDLSHSVGAVPIDLGAARADLAVGCTYKYLNGGPGSPAFLYVSADLPELTNPVAGWYGSDDPFDFDFNADRAAGATRFLTGTPPVLSAALVNPGLDLVLEAGMDRLRAKSIALTERFLALADEYLVERGFEVRSPRDADRRGSHVALAHPEARAVGQALIHEESVVPDHRPPDLLRFGFAPLYIRFADVDEAVARMVRVVDSGGADRWRETAPVVP
jgi:kynureninase